MRAFAILAGALSLTAASPGDLALESRQPQDLLSVAGLARSGILEREPRDSDVLYSRVSGLAWYVGGFALTGKTLADVGALCRALRTKVGIPWRVPTFDEMETLVYTHPGEGPPHWTLYDTPDGHFFGKVIGRHPTLIRFRTTDFTPMPDEKPWIGWFGIRLTELLPNGRITHDMAFARSKAEVRLNSADRLLCVSALGDRR